MKMTTKTDGSEKLARLIKTRVQTAQAEKKDPKPKTKANYIKARWGILRKPISYNNLSRWVANDDAEWAKSVGIYVYPKGFTREGGVVILAPELTQALVANLPMDQNLTAQDVAMGILNSIASVRPDLESNDVIRAFAIISSSKIGLQYFPNLLKLPTHESKQEHK